MALATCCSSLSHRVLSNSETARQPDKQATRQPNWREVRGAAQDSGRICHHISHRISHRVTISCMTLVCCRSIKLIHPGSQNIQTSRQPDGHTPRQPDSQTAKQPGSQTARQPDDQAVRQQTIWPRVRWDTGRKRKEVMVAVVAVVVVVVDVIRVVGGGDDGGGGDGGERKRPRE